MMINIHQSNSSNEFPHLFNLLLFCHQWHHYFSDHINWRLCRRILFFCYLYLLSPIIHQASLFLPLCYSSVLLFCSIIIVINLWLINKSGDTVTRAIFNFIPTWESYLSKEHLTSHIWLNILKRKQGMAHVPLHGMLFWWRHFGGYLNLHKKTCYQMLCNSDYI